MISSVKNQIKKLLPVSAVGTSDKEQNVDVFVTLSLKRSGQHAVINWLCSQLLDIAHFNHCHFNRRYMHYWIKPINNRVVLYKNSKKLDSGIQNRENMHSFLANIHEYSRRLYSFEDVEIEEMLLRKFLKKYKPTIILIVRDPYNWLASTLKRKDCNETQLNRKISIFIKYLEQVLHIKEYLPYPSITINYNKWATDIEYRKSICSALKIPFSEKADSSTQEVPDFGGGSSFDGNALLQNNSKDNFLFRWKEYSSDAQYLRLLNNDYLDKLTKSYFEITRTF